MTEEPVVSFEDPPKQRRRHVRGRYLPALSVLMQNPKKWGKIDSFDNAAQANSARSNLKWAIRLKRYKFPEGHEAFQFVFSVMREKKDPPSWGLYARAWPANERLPEEG